LLWLNVGETFVSFSVDDVFLDQKMTNVMRVRATQLCWNYQAVESVFSNGQGKFALIINLRSFCIEPVHTICSVIVHYSHCSLLKQMSANCLIRGVTKFIASLIKQMLRVRVQKFTIRIRKVSACLFSRVSSIKEQPRHIIAF
jgi:hypothetical protein